MILILKFVCVRTFRLIIIYIHTLIAGANNEQEVTEKEVSDLEIQEMIEKTVEDNQELKSVGTSAVSTHGNIYFRIL